MNKWEYKLVQTSGADGLNTIGKEGWEAVGFYYYGNYTVLLKRSIEEEQIDTKEISEKL